MKKYLSLLGIIVLFFSSNIASVSALSQANKRKIENLVEKYCYGDLGGMDISVNTEAEFNAMKEKMTKGLEEGAKKCAKLSEKVKVVLQNKNLSKSKKELFEYVGEKADFLISYSQETLTMMNDPKQSSFSSFMGYAADARDSKRMVDARNLVTKIYITQAEGKDITQYIKRVSSLELPEVKITYWSSKNGIETITVKAGEGYVAGTLDYAALGLKTEDFKDPSGGDYYVAYEKKTGNFQVVAVLENSGKPMAHVMGSYPGANYKKESDSEGLIKNEKTGKPYMNNESL